jgi:hypothetical protein
MGMNAIPTLAEQMELAAHALANLAGELEIDGRRYRVVQIHNEIRFFGRSKFQGEIAPSAHIAVLRSDLAKAQTLPCEYQDKRLAARCEQIVTAALAR